MLEQLKLYLNLSGVPWWASQFSMGGNGWAAWEIKGCFTASVEVPGYAHYRHVVCRSLEEIIAALEPVLCAKN
mgnify:CR=1 FL=1|jgi:hypothetical protein